MRILVHDTLATASFVLPVSLGWTNPTPPIEARPALPAAAVTDEDVALIPAAEVALLQETHQVVPDVAVVANGEGPITMRVPVRPDEIEETAVRLYHASGTAELLARATLQPYYGIRPEEWTAEDSTAAQVVVVEGAEALRDPEAGFAEDLVRAWFILTGQPVVTHLLVAPKDLDRPTLTPAIEALVTVGALAHERRRDLRRELAEREGIDRDRLARLFAAQRLALGETDRRALLMLLQRGNRGSTYPYVWDLDYLEPERSP
jgi:predicted solute-binding protein